MSRRSPFTIIELLTVVVIISILASLVLGVARYASAKSHASKTLAKLVAFEDAIEQFKQDRGFFPSSSGAGDNTIQLGDYSNTAKGFTFDSIEGAASAAIPANYPLRAGNFVNSQTGGTYLMGYKGGQYLDAWGHPFLYRCDTTDPITADQNNKQTFDLWSAGADGKVGTDDDITNWTRN